MSPPKCQNGLFIFHRDFRIKDNVGLVEACKRSKYLYTCFIFTPEQVSDQNAYRSQNAIQFLFQNSPKIPDSVIQSYIGTMLLLIRSTIIQLSNAFGTGALYTPEQIVSINLINPSQEIKLDIRAEMNTNNTSPSSILDQLKKLLCV